MDSIRISDLPQTDSVSDDSCFPVVQGNETKKVFTSTLKEKFKEPQASSTVAGIMKLFSSLGQDTDGAPTNKAVQDAISAISTELSKKINTANFSGSSHYKYCDGLLIQWGHFSHTGSHGSDVTVTFETPFSATNYSVTVQQTAYSSNETWSNTFVSSKTTTNFKFRKIFGESLSDLDYIAVGY